MTPSISSSKKVLPVTSQAPAPPKPTASKVRRFPTAKAALQRPELAARANQLAASLALVGKATKAAWATAQPQDAAPHATPFLQGFGHAVLAWIWLDLCVAANDALRPELDAACAYFFAYELPLVQAWLAPVLAKEPLLASVSPECL